MKLQSSADSQQVAAALAQRLRRVIEQKYIPRRDRLAGYRSAHWFTGLCPDPARHQRLERKVRYLVRFIREVEATLRAFKDAAR